jgi:aminopeptidase N
MRRGAVFLVALVAIHGATCGPVIEDGLRSIISKTTDPRYRLPKHIQPSEYDLKLTPYMKAEDGIKRFTFDGEVKITLKVITANQNTITLHSQDLNIDNTSITVMDGQNLIPVQSVTVQTEYSFIVLTLAQNLIINRDHVLSCKFSGNMQDDMTGFYKSSYKEGSITKYVLEY